MKKFTAAQARAAMPDCSEMMISRIHDEIRGAALIGASDTVVIFPYETGYKNAIEQIKKFLKKEDYIVSVSELESKNQIEFYVNWRY